MTSARELKRDYQAVPTRAGVYLVQLRTSGRAMVAASANVDGALNRHRFELKLGTHRNRALQADWNAQGEAAFDLRVLDRLKLDGRPDVEPAAELATLLALWQQEMACDGPAGYGQQGTPP